VKTSCKISVGADGLRQRGKSNSYNFYTHVIFFRWHFNPFQSKLLFLFTHFYLFHYVRKAQSKCTYEDY